jgi:hypothetical protein
MNGSGILCLLFDGSMYLRNVGISPNYTESQLRRFYSSRCKFFEIYQVNYVSNVTYFDAVVVRIAVSWIVTPFILVGYQLLVKLVESMFKVEMCCVRNWIFYISKYSRASEPKRLHHTLCRQPCKWEVLGFQRGITYEVSRDRRS